MREQANSLIINNVFTELDTGFDIIQWSIYSPVNIIVQEYAESGWGLAIMIASGNPYLKSTSIKKLRIKTVSGGATIYYSVVGFLAFHGTDDMEKATYDINDNGIVDKAETVDDGAGNSSNAADIKDAVDNSHAPGSDNQIASGVPFTPDGDIVATDVQAAIEEVRDDTDIKLGGKQDSLGYTAENVANKDTDVLLALNSDTKYPSQKAIKTFSLQPWVDINRDGFLNQTDTTISFDGTNTFTIAPTSPATTWSYYRAGVKYTITGSKTCVLPGSPVTTGIYYITLDSNDGTLTQSNSEWNLLDNSIPVATIVFNNSLTPKYHLADERHSILIDGRMHYYLHKTRGSQPISIGALGGFTLNSDVDVDKVFSIGDSLIADDDIIHSETGIAKPNGVDTAYSVFYRTGPTTWAWKKSNMPFIYNVGNTNNWIQWDNAGTMTDATGGGGALTRWVNSYLLVSNIEGDARFLIIPGRAIFTSLAAAQAESPSGFDFSGFIINESVVVYRLTWTTPTSTSQGKCRLAANPTPINVTTILNAGSGASIDHNTLSGLQGGQTGERYHLTDAEHVVVGDTSGVNTGDQVSTTVDFTPNGDIAATTVQEAVVEVRDDADTKLSAKEDTENKDTDETLAANSDTKYPSQKAVKSYADTKATEGAFTDISETSTITGWASLGVKKIFFKQIGSVVFVFFDLEGTSNSTQARFTLPVSANAGIVIYAPAAWASEGGVTLSEAYCQISGSTVYLAKNAAVGENWSASGGKAFTGQAMFVLA